MTPPTITLGIWLVAGLSTLQHLMYASVFYSPTAASLARRYHEQFINLSYALKLDTIAYGIWSMLHVYGLPTVTTWRFYYGLALITFGAHLNYKVHQLLGRARIYYGFELGVTARCWITAYPYSVFKHPQYLGAVLQIAGACFVFGFSGDGSPRWEIHALTVYLSLLYHLTIQVEKKRLRFY